MNIQKRIEEAQNNYVKKCRDNWHSVYGIAEAYCKADFKEGAHFGFQLCIEMIRDIPTMKNTRPNYHTELADWLETKMKEQGDGE